MIARARLTPFALPLRMPLRTARGPVHARRGVLVALESADGRVGYGEATPPDGFGAEPCDACLAAAERLCAAIVSGAGRGLGAQLARLDAASVRAPAARFAVETALCDLDARARGVPLADALAGGRAARRRVAVNALLDGASPEEAAQDASRALARGFRTLKLKLGADAPSADRARVRAVRAAIGGAAEIRIDANGAWSPEVAIATLRALEAEALELAEQPVAAADVAGLARVRNAVLVPVAADEAAADPALAEAVLAERAADALVLKPAALGGLRAALELARRAREAGVRVLVTSALDGAVARAAALALAAALPDPLPACGLATGAWLRADLGPAPEPKDGFLELSDAPGLGAAPTDAALRALATGASREVAPR